MPENSGVASVCRSGIGASIVLLPVAGRCCYVRFRQGAAVPANRGMAVRHHGWCGESATRAQNCGRASGSGELAEAAGCMPCAPGCLADSRLFAPCLTLSRCMIESHTVRRHTGRTPRCHHATAREKQTGFPNSGNAVDEAWLCRGPPALWVKCSIESVPFDLCSRFITFHCSEPCSEIV